MTIDTKRWLTIREVAEYLSINERTVRRYIKNKDIISTSLPNSSRVLIDRLALDETLENSKRGA